VEKISWRE